MYSANPHIQAENPHAAESRISDVDIAQEMSSFARSQALASAASAMPTQANDLPRALLKLLEWR